jgi:hypothetical protein
MIKDYEIFKDDLNIVNNINITCLCSSIITEIIQ